MDYSQLIIIFVVLLVVLIVTGGFIYLSSKIKSLQDFHKNDSGLTMLNQNMQGLQNRIDQTTQALSLRLDRAAQVIGAVQKELGSVQEIGRSIKDFQEFINSPKLRGNIGEQILNDSLAQIFSKEHFSLQYKFREGQIVDAIIRTNHGLIPIDSKFPMENYKKMINTSDDDERLLYEKEFVRSVKKHIDDVSKKYILPHEGTVDFAVMYVPSENIYYEIVLHPDDLFSYANKNRVLPVSPNTFLYFLKVIMMGLEKTKLQQEAQKIWELLKGLQQDAQKFSETLNLVSRHVTNAKNAIDSATSEYLRLSGKIDQVKLLK